MKYHLFLGLAAILLLSFSCKTKPAAPAIVTPVTPAEPVDMEQAWKKIDSLEQKGLMASALKEVQKIKAWALHTGGSGHLIKSVMYENKYLLTLEEDAVIRALTKAEEELPLFPEPAKSVMHSVAAGWYAHYLQSRLWELRNRTEYAGDPGPDIRTWGIRHFVDRIQHHYKQSVQWPGLTTAAVGDHTLLLTDDHDTDALRPMLFDILMHRTLDFYAGTRSFLATPAYGFVLTDPAVLTQARSFIGHSFSAQDTLSTTWQALQWFQQLIAFRLSDSERTAALIDADLKRLRFGYDHLVHEEKNELYRKALEDLLSSYEADPESSIIAYYLAQSYMELAAGWEHHPESPHRYAYNTALEICSEAISRFPDAYGSKWCRSLVNIIRQRSLSAAVENVSLPGEALLAKIDYRNLSSVHLKIVRLPSAPRRWRESNWNADEMLRQLDRGQEVASWQQPLDDGKDYQPHSTELALPALAIGHYALIVSDSAAFHERNAQTGVMLFSISSLAYWLLDDRGQSGSVAAIIDRKTGQPLQGVKVEFITYEYNASRRRQEEAIVGNALSDKDGWVDVPQNKSRNISLRLTKGQDELFTEQSYYFYRSDAGRPPDPVTLFFSDRAIYRPGQKIYFKGYALRFDAARIPSIVPHTSVTVSLYDVNGRQVTSQRLVSNAYGTFAGHFDLPAGGLTGGMSIGSSHGNGRHYFQVEEYKRPKFEVTFDTLQGMARLDETIAVRGYAKDYAGSSVSGAQVGYRVERVSYRPWWWGGYFRGRWWPAEEDRQVLTTGTAVTGDDGSVDISFLAKGKPGGDRDMMYRFEVTLYVTDITGESHEAVKSLTLNRQGYEVNIGLSGRVLIDQLKDIVISSQNSDGAAVRITGQAEISLLTGPGQNKRDRLWKSPDILTITAQEYALSFPHYFIPGMEEMSAWPVQRVLGKANIDVSGNGKADLTSFIKSPGHYKVHWLWKDESGKELAITQYVMVFAKGQALPGHEVIQSYVEDKAYEPGDAVVLDMMTGLQAPPKTIRLVERRTANATRQWHVLPVKNDRNIALAENDRGGVYVHHLATYNNRFYQVQHLVRVPWTNKDLNLTLRTWRDKLSPGDDETWTITVEGHKKEQVESEMLLSMYDASLDAFVPHQWQMHLYPSTYARTLIQSSKPDEANYWSLLNGDRGYYEGVAGRQYRDVNTYGYYPYEGTNIQYKIPLVARGQQDVDMLKAESAAPPAYEKSMADAASGAAGEEGAGEDQPATQTPPPLRSALDETVFFYPQLTTDENGNLVFSFKMKEGLTRWKFQALGHTKELAFGLTQAEVVTQKELMVFPNPPRFFRAGDTIAFQAKISGLTAQLLTGRASLKIVDAFTLEDVSAAWGLSAPVTPFTVTPSGSSAVAWLLHVPADWTRPVSYQVYATAGAVSDGEESMLPVVTNRILVTETLPLPVKANETRTFIFKSMLENRSSTSADHLFAVEMTTSPAWYAVQALPYLMEYPHECSEQVFSRLYANILASHIANTYPAIKQVYDGWRLTGSDALVSPLEKNQELKSAMLEETPWVRDAMGETQQKKDIALLFETNRMKQETRQALENLRRMQLSNGGFAWFPGGRDNWYITQYIVEGFGHLEKMGVKITGNDAASIVEKAVPYIDSRMIEWYDELKRLEAEGKIRMSDHHVSSMQVHYLYARSFFPQISHTAKIDEIRNYLREQFEKYWLKHGLYDQGLIALAGYRVWPGAHLPGEILASLRERTIYHEELGRYWKLTSGFYWNEAPVELQSLMIELYQDMGVPLAETDELRVWLLKQKQTTRWKTTKATASAIYALLIHPDSWLEAVGIVSVSLGGAEVIGKSTPAEAGTGYVKKSWDGDRIGREWSSVTVSNPNNHIAWGSAYWQYWEDIDKVKTSAENNPLKVTRSLLISKESDRGPQTTLAEGRALHVGDKLIVRLTVETDRAMEFVHLKDLRASGFEPVDVLSGYKWGGGPGYYQSTKDLATHFFIDYLPRGKHVIEYTVTVAQAGSYSEGLAMLQCMYAPEFGSHTAGSRVAVE